jgi:hypothetical protein
VQLVFEQGPRAGQAIPLEGAALTVGRGRETDLALPVEGISRQHARLQQGPGGWSLVDLGSTNGTFVNGQRLPPGEPCLLRPGDRVAFASLALRVEGELAPAAPPEPGWDEAAGPAAEPPARPRPVLMIVGAVALIAVLAGIVLLIVTLLQPKPGPVTPTVAGPVEQIMTSLPVPTEFEGIMATIMPALPSGLPFFPSGATATPTPEAALRGQEVAGLQPANGRVLPLALNTKGGN